MSDLPPIQRSRIDLPRNVPRDADHRLEAEGGCGVIGVASSIPIAGRHIIASAARMCNRGNGKGGGIAVGCFPEFKNHYALNVAYLAKESRRSVEERFIAPYFDIAHVEEQAHLEDYREFPRLEIEPPLVVRYLSRVKPALVKQFAEKYGFEDAQSAEDEFVYQNSFRLNKSFYADLDDKAAFVLSHGRNMMILKAVGYCEDLAQYYQLQDLRGYVWIGHQRYPTRGRVWHPGGAHPFSGMDEALVHNGDFANYYGVREYLRPRGYEPLFLTDTEVAVLQFDLYNRVYRYPLEYIFEALAPTTEHDFAMLPPDKQQVYKAIQRAHLHGSPDGPWFFIIARSDPRRSEMQLLGITDTSMLRPQVFALQESGTGATKIGIGAIASEKQAIDTFFQSLAREDDRIAPVADMYWNARGGSHSDGGAFVYTVGEGDWRNDGASGKEILRLVCADKFGREVQVQGGIRPFQEAEIGQIAVLSRTHVGGLSDKHNSNPREVFESWIETDALARCSFDEMRELCQSLGQAARTGDESRGRSIELLTLLNDRRYDCGEKKRSSVLAIVREALNVVFDEVPLVPSVASNGSASARMDWKTRAKLAGADGITPRPSWGDGGILFVDAGDFPPDGDSSVARLIVEAYRLGWKRFVIYRCKGDRFIGCGLGPDSRGVRIDVYGSSGDYLGSGLDGAEIFVHDDAQDQVGQILKSGKIVIFGMVGQTFLYGAKGGAAFVMRNAAGRPLINAVGSVRAVINGTCLDYCAESFMAGAETGGGFVIINGLEFDGRGNVRLLAEPYPGGNFFSLASGGAGYIADPARRLTDDQLNEAVFVDFRDEDWRVIEPYVRENAAYFGLPVEALLAGRSPREVYRKVAAAKKGAVAKAEEVGE
jgi:glutamate synthase domain-containing protein 1/glutamate synthase domain-containing protein 3